MERAPVQPGRDRLLGSRRVVAWLARAARFAALRRCVSLLERDLRSRPAVAPASDPWTDDHAPVEWVTDRMIVSFAARGGELDEAPLPTAP